MNDCDDDQTLTKRNLKNEYMTPHLLSKMDYEFYCLMLFRNAAVTYCCNKYIFFCNC